MSEARQNGDGDPVRLLHRRAELGYTDRNWLAMTQEPEAVSEADQAWLSDRAKINEKERLRSDWAPFQVVLLRVLDEAQERPFAQSIRDELRTIRRGVERVGKRL